MTGEALTSLLAERVMGWRYTPGRFIKSGRAWIPSWRFSPLTSLEDAFLLLDTAAGAYTLVAQGAGAFQARVRVGLCTGRASDTSKARTITIALARALGIAVPDESTVADSPPVRQGQMRPGRRINGA
jgi:hypothetical protein